MLQRAHCSATRPASANRGSACSTSGRCIQPLSLQPRLCSRQLPAHTACAATAPRRCEQLEQLQRFSGTAANAQSAVGKAKAWDRLNWELLLLVCSTPVAPALAADGLNYNPTQGEGLVKTLSGAAYIGLLLYFLIRVLNRRARKAREERLAGQGPVSTVFTKLIEKATEGKERPKVTPLAAFTGAAQAGVIAYGLFIFTSKVETLISAQNLPSGYTAANIAITVRTIIIGLLYLATFIFSANALGLTGLSIQLLFFPDSIKDDEPANRTPKGPQLPKVTVTSSPDEIRRAFDSVAREAAATAAREAAAATSSSDGTAASTTSSDSGK